MPELPVAFLIALSFFPFLPISTLTGVRKAVDFNTRKSSVVY
jgi:hypothetical protein